MQHYKEFDYSYSWINVTLQALKSGFNHIQYKSKEFEWFDGICQLEYIENILGIAFITAQTYILGVVGDIKV